MEVEIVDCGEDGDASFDPDTGVLKLQIPRGCDGEPGDLPGLPDDLTRIAHHSWDHASTNGYPAEIELEDRTARGLVVEFTAPVLLDHIDPLHVFRVWVARPAEGGFTMEWTQLFGVVRGVEVIRSGGAITYKAVPDSETTAEAAAFLLDEKHSPHFERYTGPVRIELHGDFVLDTNERAIDANYVQARLPTSDIPDQEVGLPGGTFISWFRKTQRRRFNINSATRSDLVALPHVGEVIARRIMEAPPFSRREELLDIEGITPAVFNAIRDRVTLAEEDES